MRLVVLLVLALAVVVASPNGRALADPGVSEAVGQVSGGLGIPGDHRAHSRGRVLVGFASTIDAADRRALVRSGGARALSVVGAGTHVLAVPDGRVDPVAADLRGRRGVEYAEPDYLLRASAAPN